MVNYWMSNIRHRVATGLHFNPWLQPVCRDCTCRAKRGRPRKSDKAEAAEFDQYQQPVDAGYEPASRQAGRSKTAVQADQPLSTIVEPLVSQ